MHGNIIAQTIEKIKGALKIALVAYCMIITVLGLQNFSSFKVPIYFEYIDQIGHGEFRLPRIIGLWKAIKNIAIALLFFLIHVVGFVVPVIYSIEAHANTERQSPIESEKSPKWALEKKKLKEIYQENLRAMEIRLQEWHQIRNSEQMLEVECDIQQFFMKMADKVTGMLVKETLDDEDFCKQARKKARQRNPKLQAADKPEVTLTLLGGSTIKVKTSYLRYRQAKDRSRKGPTRGVGKRGKGGAGVYPALLELGFYDRLSPALQSTVARTATEVSSYEVARQILAERGMNLNAEKIRKINLAVGKRSLLAREIQVQKTLQNQLPSNKQWEGKRLAVSIDGGRIRLRENKRGRPLNNGFRRFSANWRQPLLLVIYEFGKNGRKVRHSLPINDATLEHPDVLMDIILMHLKAGGAEKASEVVLIGDGAEWIWNREHQIFSQLPNVKTQGVVDFYHACGYLSRTSQSIPVLDEQQQNGWFKRHRRLLKNGRVDQIISSLQDLQTQCVQQGLDGDEISTAISFFSGHQHRMNYPLFKGNGIPIGSGSVESSIRRIVNLRFKGNSVFWKKENAEKILILRCALKSGRWEQLFRGILSANQFYYYPDTG